MSSKKSVNVLLGVTGSVAAIKLYDLIDALKSKLNKNLNVCIIPTANALHFTADFELRCNSQLKSLEERLAFIKRSASADDSADEAVVFSFADADEWSSWSERTDPVLHIDLRKWADLMLIAPLDANTLAKISNGICDNLLTCVVRAWDLRKMHEKPIVICPAMNTCMYDHVITQKQLGMLVNEFQFVLIHPVEKVLVCGDKGVGAMAHVDDITNWVASFFSKIIKTQ